jgi:hypothetical protein
MSPISGLIRVGARRCDIDARELMVSHIETEQPRRFCYQQAKRALWKILDKSSRRVGQRVGCLGRELFSTRRELDPNL